MERSGVGPSDISDERMNFVIPAEGFGSGKSEGNKAEPAAPADTREAGEPIGWDKVHSPQEVDARRTEIGQDPKIAQAERNVRELRNAMANGGASAEEVSAAATELDNLLAAEARRRAEKANEQFRVPRR